MKLLRTRNGGTGRVTHLWCQVPLLAVALTAACDSATIPPAGPWDWRAEIAGTEEYAAIAGQAILSAEGEVFEVELQVAGLPDATHHWEVRAGMCTAPGGVIGPAGSYRRLEPVNGAASATTSVPAVLAPGAPYFTAVFQLVEPGEEHEDQSVIRVEIACGDFVRTG
jgi:hypothetical protein